MFCIEQHKDNLNKLTKDIKSPFFFYDLEELESNLKTLKPYLLNYGMPLKQTPYLAS